MTNTSELQTEPWVDAKTVAKHVGFKPDHIRKLAQAGKIPARSMQNGAKAYWRFRISVIDQWMSQGAQRGQA